MSYIPKIGIAPLRVSSRETEPRLAPPEKGSASGDSLARGTPGTSAVAVELHWQKTVHERPGSSGSDVGGSLVPNRAPEGGVQSRQFSSAKAAIASMLGVVTYPAPGSIKINGRLVSVDLANDSLTRIAARILAEAQTNAQVLDEEVGGSRLYRLVVDGDVAPSTPSDVHVATLMGFLQPEPSALGPVARPLREGAPGDEGRPALSQTAAESEQPVEEKVASRVRLPAWQERLEASRRTLVDEVEAIDEAVALVREQAAPLADGSRRLQSSSEGRS